MYGNGGGGKAARADKKSKADKPVNAKKAYKTMDNPKPAKKLSDKTQAPLTSGRSASASALAKPPKKEKGITLQERAEKMAAARGLAKLDVLEIPLKPSARREMFRNQRKGK